MADLVGRDERRLGGRTAALRQAVRIGRLTHRPDVGDADGVAVEIAARHQMRNAECLLRGGPAAIVPELREQVRRLRLGEGVAWRVEDGRRRQRDFHAELGRKDTVDDVHARDDGVFRRAAAGHELLSELVVGDHAHAHLFHGRELCSFRVKLMRQVRERLGGRRRRVGLHDLARHVFKRQHRIGKPIHHRVSSSGCEGLDSRACDVIRGLDGIELVTVEDHAAPPARAARDTHP